LWKSNHRKCNITAGYHLRKLHQMYHNFIKVDQGHMCLTFPYLVFYTAKRAWNKDSWHRQPAKTLDTNLFWLWPERHQCCRDHLRSCVHAGGGHFERMLWPECSFIWFTKTFCQCNLMHVMAKLKLCSHAFSVFRLSQGSVTALIRWGGWSSYLHMYRSISKSNSETENYIEIRWFLTKLQTKIIQILFYVPRCSWRNKWYI